MIGETYKFSTKRGEVTLSYLKVSANGTDKNKFYLNGNEISMKERYSYKHASHQEYFMKVVLKNFNEIFI